MIYTIDRIGLRRRLENEEIDVIFPGKSGFYSKKLYRIAIFRHTK